MTRYYDPGEDPEQERRERLESRLESLRLERRGRPVMVLIGVALVALAAGTGAFVLQALHRGYMKADADSFIFAAAEPGSFYASVALLGAMAAYMGYLGVSMLLHVRREARHAARFGERLAKLQARQGR